MIAVVFFALATAFFAYFAQLPGLPRDLAWWVALLACWNGFATLVLIAVEGRKNRGGK